MVDALSRRAQMPTTSPGGERAPAPAPALVTTAKANTKATGWGPPSSPSPKAAGKVQVEKSVEASSDSPGSLKVSGSFDAKISGKKGYGVSFGVSAEASVVSGQKTEKGVTSFSVSADAHASVKAGVSAPSASVSGSHTEGFKATYELKVPEAAAKGLDPKRVNPFDPSTMPKGAVATLDGARYSETNLKATFKKLAVESKVGDERGLSVAVAKTGDHTVRVTAGPTAAMRAYSGVGVDLGVASAMLGRNDQLSSAVLHTAEFDLRSPHGRAAYNDFLASGTLPKATSAGVTDVATITKVDSSSQGQATGSLGPLSGTLTTKESKGQVVTTARPDGSIGETRTVRWGSSPPLSVSREIGADGKEDLTKRRYTFTFTPPTNEAATALNIAMTGKQDSRGGLQPNEPVAVTFDEGQMKQFMEMTHQVYEGGKKMDHDLGNLLKKRGTDVPAEPSDFAFNLALSSLNASEAGQAGRWFKIMNQHERYQPGKHLPGTVSTP